MFFSQTNKIAVLAVELYIGICEGVSCWRHEPIFLCMQRLSFLSRPPGKLFFFVFIYIILCLFLFCFTFYVICSFLFIIQSPHNGVPKTIITDKHQNFATRIYVYNKDVLGASHTIHHRTTRNPMRLQKEWYRPLMWGYKHFHILWKHRSLPTQIVSKLPKDSTCRKKTNSFCIMGRQIRVSINVWYRKDKESDPEKTKFLLQEGHNTTILGKNRQHVLAHADQF